MYINPDVWEFVKSRKKGRGIVKEAQEISAVVEAIATGVAIGTIYSLAYNETKRYLEHVNRIEKFREQRRRERLASYHPRRRYPGD
jgi:hypothetical protein